MLFCKNRDSHSLKKIQSNSNKWNSKIVVTFEPPSWSPFHIVSVALKQTGLEILQLIIVKIFIEY